MMIRWWRDLSVSKKLYSVVGLMAFLIAMELVTLKFVMNTLSAVRSFVGGEGLWSKAQKSAVNSLQKYALTGDQKYFQEYQQYLSVTLGDRQARLELLKPNYNFSVVEDGFVKGGIHSHDVPGLVRVLRNLYMVSYIKRAVEVWTAADKMVDDLEAAANTLHKTIRAGKRGSAQFHATLNRIYRIDNQLTVLENEFSYVLGEGSRWLESFLMIALVLFVLTVESTGLLLTFSFSRNLNRSLSEMNEAATAVGQGHFDRFIPVRSKDELGELAMAINKMTDDLKKNIGERKQAESANQIKTLFLANMSHEIRTPLGVILGLTEILKNNEISAMERRQYLDIIDRTGHNLSQLINDILDISKVEAGYLEIEESQFSLPGFLNELYEMLGVQAKLNRIAFNARGAFPQEVVTDKSRLRQILINLLNNALKFTQDGTVQLNYWSSSSELCFEISDNGIGMSEEQKKNLFSIFYQADPSVTRKHEGTGLGLTLSKRLAKALGGDVTLVDSKEQRGSIFLVTIPLDHKASAQNFSRLAKASNEESLRDKKILVVEDNKDNQLLIGLFLNKTGAHLSYANNGEEGYKQALADDFDAVLMDIQMPVTDGYSAIKRLRKEGYRKPVIAITAHAMTEEKSKCFEVGFDDYLAKPLTSHLLKNTIEKHV
ncbi:MAG: ATP-binding protein [Bdellovibrionales bacterium]